MDEQPYDQGDGDELDLEHGAALLAELEACLATCNAATARAVALAGRLATTTISERVDGLRWS